MKSIKNGVKSNSLINIKEFQKPILEILQNNPGGITEFDLIKALEKKGLKEFTRTDHQDDLELFRSHFFLFHLLYRLKDYLREKRRYTLSIHCLKIELGPYIKVKEDTGITLNDPLRDYYLDLSHLEKTDARAVEKMLDNFWRRYFRQEEKIAALKVLGFSEEPQINELKQKYRALCRKHHPDTGGDPEKFRQIQEAMETLNQFPPLYDGS